MRTLRDLFRILPEKHKRGGKVSADVAGWLGKAKLLLDQGLTESIEDTVYERAGIFSREFLG
jgi:hypothetical protein